MDRNIDVLNSMLSTCHVDELSSQLAILDQMEAWYQHGRLKVAAMTARPQNRVPFSSEAVSTAFALVSALEQHAMAAVHAERQNLNHESARISVMQSALGVLLSLTTWPSVTEWLQAEKPVLQLGAQLSGMADVHGGWSAVAEAGDALQCICLAADPASSCTYAPPANPPDGMVLGLVVNWCMSPVSD